MPATVTPLAELLAGSGPWPAEEALRVVAQLARQVTELHAVGQLHSGIDLAAVSIDGQGRASLEMPDRESELGWIELSALALPPEFGGALPQILPYEIESAQAALQVGGNSLDPRRIDIFQLGSLLCQLLTGESVESYLQSPQVKARVPVEAREILDRALGFVGRGRCADALAVAVGLEQAVKALGREPPPTHDTSPSLAGVDRQSDTSAGRQADNGRKAAGQLPFDRLGDYQIVGRLGSGGMGDVYEGFEPKLKRHVAIKVLPTELARHEEFVRRFHAEASAAAQLSHPHIVAIHFIGEDAGRHFFVMEYVKGESLADLLKRRPRLAVDEAIPIIEQALSGLGAAHKQGLVHRDIKPANLLIDRANQRVLIADFGIAKSLAEGGSTTSTGMVLGTADYISPEQARSQAVDGRSDLYSVGAMLFQMLTGRLPFEADSATALIFKHVYDPPPNLAEVAPHLPPRLVALVMRLLAKSPADRYATAGEVLVDLRQVRQRLPAEQDAPRTTSIIKAPVFAELSLPAEEPEPPETGWFKRAKLRAVHALRRQAPELVDRLQNTQQQVDGAVYQYERRCRELRILVQEAEGVVAELRRQASDHRTEAESLDVTADPRRKRLECLTTADDLDRQAAEQDEELSELRLRLAQSDATLLKLRSQRDALAARLRAARAQSQLESPRSTARWRRRAAALGLAAGLVIATTIVLVVAYGLLTKRKIPAAFDNSLNMHLVYIPPGEFDMGSPEGESKRFPNETRHHVRLTKGFYLGAHEVTVGQFREFVTQTKYVTEAESDGLGGMGFNSRTKGFEQGPQYTWRYTGFVQRDDHPVVNVSWNDAQAFCEWLSKNEHKKYRLPTEAEWEYACRAGTKTAYYSGDNSETLVNVGNVADASATARFPTWPAIQSSDKFVFTAPVGKFQPNAFELFDMHGNVWEWCSDWYAEYPGDAIDPQGPESGTDRVMRGAAWPIGPSLCRSAQRGYAVLGKRSYDWGFRVACEE